jgi:tRNA pseudouridine55 synthase
VISGILPVDKPLGWTSHDVVGRVRRAAGQKQVGHAGTLDPLATGLLLLVLGRATRLSAYLMSAPKIYCAEVVLGATTTTDDAEAPLLDRRDPGSISLSDIERCLQQFVGTIAQIPPVYAAVRHGGEKMYVLARKGITVEAPPREVSVDGIEILGWTPPRLRLRIRCGSGTYIRSLARDIGSALGVGGYLHALRRVASGSFSVAGAVALTELSDDAAVRRAIEPSDRAVLDWPAVVVSDDDVQAIQSGRSVPLSTTMTGRVRVYSSGGRLVALGESMGDIVKPFRVFNGQAERDAHRL